ncbi:MAG: serine hydrolase [Pseudomonadales bacterium]|nr:serine hydrolase [Pseudomonadales bacterium]
MTGRKIHLLTVLLCLCQGSLLWAQPLIREVVDTAALQRSAAQLPRLQSLLISQHGELLFEEYYGGRQAQQPANLKSASKSVISALVGLAISEGFIRGVDQPIADFFPDYQAVLATGQKRQITVGNLLTMQSGLESTSNRNYGRWVMSENWVASALGQEQVAAPGTAMIYSTGSTHLLSAIITRSAGMSTREFAQKYLADPLGFRMAYWSQDPQGIYFGGNDMEITPRQMLRFGQLYLDKGVFGDTQVLPEQWVRDSFTPHAESPRGQGRYYGYGWWLREMDGILVPTAWGYGGQLIFVLEELATVVVVTSDSIPGENRRGHLASLYRLMEEQIVIPLRAAESRALRSSD